MAGITRLIVLINGLGLALAIGWAQPVTLYARLDNVSWQFKGHVCAMRWVEEEGWFLPLREKAEFLPKSTVSVNEARIK
jgi:hypothetical protein